MKRTYTVYYSIFMSFAMVGIQKAASHAALIDASCSTEMPGSPREQDSPRTQAQKIIKKAYSSYHIDGEKPHLKFSQSATSDSLVEIAESTEMCKDAVPVSESRSTNRDHCEDRLDAGFNRLSVSPSSLFRRNRSGTLAALRIRFPRGRTGLSDEVKNIESSQEQTESDAAEGIKVES